MEWELTVPSAPDCRFYMCPIVTAHWSRTGMQMYSLHPITVGSGAEREGLRSGCSRRRTGDPRTLDMLPTKWLSETIGLAQSHPMDTF